MVKKNIVEKRSQLSAAKQALLAKRLRGKLISSKADRDSVSLLPTIVPDPDRRHLPFPLNDMQQAYWIGRNSFFELGNVSIHAYFEIEIIDLDIEQFNLAWQRLIERHDMLRAIVLSDGQQQILKQVPPYQIEVLDFRGQDPQVVASQLEVIRDRMSHQVLPSDQWPLFEIHASRVNDQRTRLHISIDGIFFDAWSYQILLLELVQLYQNPQALLEPLELSFRDYVLALVDIQESSLFKRSLEYWQNRIPTLPPAPELPLAKNPSSLSDPKFVRRRAHLEPEAWLRLKNRAARDNLTPTGVLLAVYAEILTVWSKSPRFTINVPRFDRLPLHPQVNKIIGEFASSSLLEVDNSEQNSFEIRAKRIQEQLWQDLEHQFVSSVRVLRELAHNRKSILVGATMPVVFTSTPKEVEGRDVSSNTELPADLGEIVYSLSQTPQVWLDFQYGERNGFLEFNLDAVEELFPRGMVDDIFAAYCHLLQRLADGEEAWQEKTRQLLPPAQLAQRTAINAIEAPVPEETLHSLFAFQALQRPQQIAVLAPNRTLTYEELYRRSHQIGRCLRHKCTQPNTLVAVVMEKGWEQVAAVLGILTSGAAYLPIDPELPRERLWYLLENGKVQQVLTQSWLNDNLEWPENIQRLCVDSEELLSENDQPIELVNKPDDLAYVIYTSGSTGFPKGVMITHQSVVNAIIYTNQRFDVNPKDRVLALTALHHDMSVFDIFGVLTAGGTIIIPEASARRDPAHWSELMRKEQVTIWNSVPAMMEMLVEHATAQLQLRFDTLRLAFLGGDWIGLTLPTQIKNLASGVQVVSVGGPTETTLWNICYLIETIDQTWKSIPYGKPIANARYYILNEALEDCPAWVAGQMYCAGKGLAKGYWQDEEKTRTKFIIHPQTGERLYQTGDLGRYLSDGNIEFLGRVDFQMNILGRRIEAGEIEASLAQHPGVRVAVVTSIGEQQDKQQLVAYVVPNQEPAPTIDELRNFLSKKIPAYMVPSIFILLDALPLTPNGKVDRRALPSPERLHPELETAYVMPETEMEQNIANIWQKVLNVEKIGIHDNFFHLGGDSLLATKVITRLREAFHIELPLSSLFEQLTVAGLSDRIERIQSLQQLQAPLHPTDLALRSSLEPIEPVSRDQTLPLSYSQERMWVLDHSAFNLYNATRIIGELNITVLKQTLNEIVRRHEVLRTIFLTVDGQPMQVILPKMTLTVPVVDLQHLSETERQAQVRQLTIELGRQPFDFTSEPPLRVHLLLLAPEESVLIFNSHHMVFDDWSRAIFFEEFLVLYKAFSAGKPSPLADFTVQFADFAYWQRQWLQGEVLEKHLSYWKNKLANAPQIFGSREIRSLPADSYHFDLPSSLYKSLLKLSRQENVTLFIILLAAFKLLLYIYTSQNDVVLACSTANRLRSEISGLIGFFANSLILRTDLSGNPTFQELLQRMHKVHMEAQEHHDLPVEKLREELAIDQGQVLFNFMKSSKIDTDEFPIQISPIDLEIDRAQQMYPNLFFILIDDSVCLHGILNYTTNLFDSHKIHEIISLYREILEKIAEQPKVRFSQFARDSEQKTLRFKYSA